MLGSESLTFSVGSPDSLAKALHRSATTPILGTTTRYWKITNGSFSPHLELKPVPKYFQENGSYLHGSELRVSADQEHLHSAILFHGQGQCEVAEGVEGNRNFGAFWADQCRFEQAMEDVHDNGIIPQSVIRPCFLSYNLQTNEIPTNQATFFSLKLNSNA